MAGTKGKGKASAAKSKPKAPSMVSALPEPVVSEESSEGPLDGEENKIKIPSAGEQENGDKKIEIPSTDVEENDDKKIEIPSTDEENDDKKIEIPSTDEKENGDKKIEIASMVTDEKENTVNTSGLLVGNGVEENQQLADEGNDDEKVSVDAEKDDAENNDDENGTTDELNANEVKSLSGQTEETKEADDDDDAANNVNSENDGVDCEENTEKLSDGSGAVNMDVENNEGKPDEEMTVEVKEPVTYSSSDKNIHSGEENKDMEVAKDGKMVTGQSLAASEHGVTDEEMTSKGASDNLNVEEPLPTSANNEKTAEEIEKVTISDNVGASAEKAKKPRRKLIRKKLIKREPEKDASVDANSAETKEHERNEEKTELKQPVTINRKLNRKRRPTVSESNAVGAAVSDRQKAEPTNNEQGTEVPKETDKLEVGDEMVKKSGNKANRFKKRRKQKVSNDVTTGDAVRRDINKAGPSQKGKSKKVDTMGMIFMCNSETKKDCYHYRVLGLPPGKKDFVSNIDKGMTLFLFDVDLKMLYGIYEAAAPGGFDIEPRAFKSKFPSQVRFTVLEDCVPLAEEKFKGAIRENYYTKNKFNCTLSSVQVGRLCALFRGNTRKADSARFRNPVPAAPTSQRDRKRKRTKGGHNAHPVLSFKREGPYPEREVRERRRPERDVRERRRPERDVRERRHPEREVTERRHPEREARGRRESEREARGRRESEREARERRESEREARERRESEREVRERRHSEREVRAVPAVVDDRYYQQPGGYERDAYLPPLAPTVLYQAIPSPSLPEPSSYSYVGPTRVESYLREPVLDRVPVIERRDLGLPSLGRPAEDDRLEPYAYNETRAAYLEKSYETGIRRDLIESSARRDLLELSTRHDLLEPSARRDLLELSARRDLLEPSARREHYDYTSDARPVEYYATEYRPPLPPYRSY